MLDPGGVPVEPDVGGEEESPGTSRSFDIFNSEAGITTVVFADRTLGAGEPCACTCGRGNGRECEGDELASGVALVRSIVRRLVPIAPKESSGCGCGCIGE